MTLEQIRIKIAEARGWTRVTGSYLDVYKTPTGIGPRGGDIVKLPDPYDLNECHEMEESLTLEQLAVYGNLLDDITRPKNTMQMLYVHNPEAGMYPELFRATAAQRCEAFLKTLKLLKL